MAKINFRSAFKKARRGPAYWVERAILDYTSALAARLKQTDITQRELALRIDVSPAYVNKVLNGTPNLTIKTMVELAHAVGLRLRIDLKEVGLDDVNEVAWGETVNTEVKRHLYVASNKVLTLKAANEELCFGGIQRVA